MPKISVIIPIYNVEKYLTECLDSVLNQTFQDFEIVCINDGSTDGSLKILEDYVARDSRIVLINQQNKGVAVARNVGIDSAKGEYIQFLDGDDWLELNTLEELYNVASKQNSDIVMFGMKKVKDLDVIKLKYITDLFRVYSENLEDCLSLTTYSTDKFFKKDFIIKNKIKFIPKAKTAEDGVFALSCFFQKPDINFLEEYFYNYRIIETSVTNNIQKGLISDIDTFSLFFKNEKFLETNSSNKIATLKKAFLGINHYWKEDEEKKYINVWYNQISNFIKTVESIFEQDILKQLRLYNYFKTFITLDETTKFVSVVVPVYNCEKYLKNCLEVLTNQKLKNIELIFVDDNSTDNSYKIIEEYCQKDNRIKLLKNDKKGAGSARNVGLKAAVGEYLLFLDADDIYSTTICFDTYLYAKSTNADLVFWNYKQYNVLNNEVKSVIQTEKLEEGENYSPSNDYFSFLISAPNPWTKLIKRSFVLYNNLEFQDLSSCNDISFVWKCLALSEASYYLQKELVTYRMQTDGSITSSRYKKAENILKAAEDIKAALINFKLEHLLKNFYKSIMSNFVYEYCQFPENVSTDEYEKKVINFLPDSYREEMKKYFRNKTFPARYCTYTEKIFEKLNRTILDNKNIALWGASLFLEDFLNTYNVDTSNILGIIDANPNKKGKKIYNYTIYSPDQIKELNPKYILLTIKNNNEQRYIDVQNFLAENRINTELLPNIFEEPLHD